VWYGTVHSERGLLEVIDVLGEPDLVDAAFARRFDKRIDRRSLVRDLAIPFRRCMW